MVYYLFLFAHWLSLCYIAIIFWPLDISMVYYLLLFWPTGYLYGTLSFPIGQLAIYMVHYPFLLVHWLSLWYTTIFFWPTGYPNGTLPSPISPLAIHMIHYYLLLAHWISKWYTTSISVVHYYLLLAHWISQWYTTLFYWPPVYLYGTLLSSTGPLDISMVYYLIMLAH